MFKIVSVVFITLSMMIIHGDRSLVQAEVFEGGINDISHEANPWRRFWGGQCDSDASCTYIVSYCHYKKTGKCSWHIIFFLLPSILTSSICSKHLSSRLVVFSYCEAWDFLLRSCYGFLHCGLPDFLHWDQRTSWLPCPRLRCSSVRNLDSEAEVFLPTFLYIAKD